MAWSSGFGRCRLRLICIKWNYFLGKKLESLKPEECDLLDRQALGAIRLTLAKSIAYNIINEKTTHNMMKALVDMYEKPSASNKVYFIWILVNINMTKGSDMTGHINFNSLVPRLFSLNIKFDNEVQALFLMPDSCDGMSTTTSSTFKGVRGLIDETSTRRIWRVLARELKFFTEHGCERPKAVTLKANLE